MENGDVKSSEFNGHGHHIFQLEMNGGIHHTDQLPKTFSWWQIVLGKQAAARGFHGEGWKVIPYVLVGEFGEKVSSFGLQFTLLHYLMYELNYSLESASGATTNFIGASSIATLGGAFIADAYLGRFLTLTIGCLFYILGLAVFSTSAMFGVFRPDGCTTDERNLGLCQPASMLQVFVLGMALFLLCVGSGAVKPSAPPFGADQFDKSKTQHLAHLRHFFNWYYTILAMAMFIALVLVVSIEDIAGWGWAGVFCVVVVTVGTLVFLAGSPKFVYVPPTGSALTKLAQVVVAAVRKWKLKMPENPEDLHEARKGLDDKESQLSGKDQERPLTHTGNFRCLDKAAILEAVSEQPDEGKRLNPWRLVTVHQVEELKIMLRIVPVWLCSIVSSMVIIQSATFVTVQAQSLNRYVGALKLPATSMPLFSVITLLVFIPLYDQVLIKTLRKLNGHPKGLSYLQRIGAGLFLSMATMACAALVESKRRGLAQKTGVEDDTSTVLPMSVLWLVPQLILAGLTESFVAIGQMELFYDEAPVSLRSLSNALFWTALGIGAFTNSLVIKLVQSLTKSSSSDGWLQSNINKGHLDSYYWLLTSLATANFLAFLYISTWYVYKYADRNDSQSDDAVGRLGPDSEEEG